MTRAFFRQARRQGAYKRHGSNDTPVCARPLDDLEANHSPSPMLLFDFLLAGLVIGGIYALISIGLNLQYGVARVLNLAYGECLMLAGVGAFFAFERLGAPPLLTMLVGAPVAFGASWLLFRFVLHPLL